MAAVGGFCPLPIRLGGDAVSGWSAEQHARACADAVAMGRTAPFARVVVTISGATTGTVDDYIGMNGIGMTHAPSISVSGSVATLTWPTYWEDQLGRRHPVNIRTVAIGRPGAADVASPNQVTVRRDSRYGDEVFLTVYGSPLETASIADYGGSKDKQNCASEQVPYAAGWYEFMQGARGDAFSRERTGLVHAENLALARNFAWQTRLGEQFASNQNPATAGVLMPEWVQILSLDPSATDEANRGAAAAKMRVRQGNTPTIIDDMILALLGDRLVRTWRTHGTLTSPPTNTYGPAWETAPSGFPDLGGGAWSSPIARVVVEVESPTAAETGDFLRDMGALTRQLDAATPAYMTFTWCTGLSDTDDPDPDAVLGFRLDYGRMDYDGLT